MKKLKHSKFKNTGILYELLVRQITADILEGVDNSVANKLLQRYFSENKPLGKEWKLYNLFLTERAKDESHANYFIDLILNSRNKLSNAELSKQKFNLVKEIKENYNIENFFRSNVNNYKTLASIYKLFESHTNVNIDYNPKEIYQSKNHLCEVIIGKQIEKIKENTIDKTLSYYETQDKDVKLFSYKLLVDSFNKKYSKLNEKQKILLREYINNVSNTNNLRSYADSEVDDVRNKLKLLNKKINNSVVKIKLNETINQLEKIKEGKLVKDNQILALLCSYELIEELENVIKS